VTTETPARFKAGVLTYPGDVVGEILEDPVKGPDVEGNFLIAVSAMWWNDTNTTTVEFHYATEDDLQQRIMKSVIEQARIPAAFGGVA
jgi:hypothetical protein